MNLSERGFMGFKGMSELGFWGFMGLLGYRKIYRWFNATQ